MSQSTRPYLSVVATARNDDHGGNLLQRLQIFVNALITQARRHQFSVELVLVEWNPPHDRLPLSRALRWPSDFGRVEVRVITVPSEIHQHFRLARELPLYQMIGKNVGIRRARGKFILATNIDILFSDELLGFMAAGRLEHGRMYRIDRHDVASDVPVDGPVDEQLAWCRTHRLRLNAIEGTFPLTPEGYRQLAPSDVSHSADCIFFGAGWYPPEQVFGDLFRWAADDSEVHFSPSARARVLRLETAAGPGVDFKPFELDVSGSAIAVPTHAIVRIPVPADVGSVHLRVSGGGQPSPPDGRTLNFRVSLCDWSAGNDTAPSASPAPARRTARSLQTAGRAARFLGDLRHRRGTGRIGVPLSRAVLDRLQVRAENYGISVAFRKSMVSAQPSAPAPPAHLHTNACGDFTLAHRDHWFELRGYPELDLYSMNIDSLFCFMAHYGGAKEQVLPEPMRIYHIEHAAGSGWTPEGSKLLFDRLAARGIPWLDYSQVLEWAAEMERFHTTMIFNRDDWGLSQYGLPDVTIPDAS